MSHAEGRKEAFLEVLAILEKRSKFWDDQVDSAYPTDKPTIRALATESLALHVDIRSAYPEIYEEKS